MFLLADPMCPINGLQIRLWVPIVVVHDHDIGCLQVDPQAPSTGGQQEHELRAAWCVELFNVALTLYPTRVSINTAIFVATDMTVVCLCFFIKKQKQNVKMETCGFWTSHHLLGHWIH